VELYLVFEYVRVQDLVPGLAMLRLPFGLIILLTLLVLPRLGASFQNRQAWGFAGLLVLMALHVPVATNNYWALEFFLSTGNMLVLFLAITQVVTTPARVRHLIGAWLLIHAVLAVYAIARGGVGPGGFLGDENDLALAMNMFLPFPLFLFFAATPYHRRRRLLGSVCLTLGALFATMSRGGFLGLLAVGGYSFWKSNRKRTALAALAFAVLIASVAAPQRYLEEMLTIWEEATGSVEGTGAEREYSWRVGLRMFLSNPIFGVGQGNFPWAFSQYEGEDRFHTRSLAGRAAHSLYLTVLPELGLVGGLIFLAMILRLVGDLRAARARLRPGADKNPEAAHLLAVGWAVEAALVGYLVSGAFISVFYYPPFWLLVAFAATLRNVAAAAPPAAAAP
jgi:O-antigen ligase